MTSSSAQPSIFPGTLGKKKNKSLSGNLPQASISPQNIPPSNTPPAESYKGRWAKAARCRSTPQRCTHVTPFPSSNTIDHLQHVRSHLPRHSFQSPISGACFSLKSPAYNPRHARTGLETLHRLGEGERCDPRPCRTQPGLYRRSQYRLCLARRHEVLRRRVRGSQGHQGFPEAQDPGRHDRVPRGVRGQG
ncbi:hypothetical protein MPH_09534 [Macrophomina phaseolina MS6]|uniref:Uncharacterized protein n=1 Tax=Macrophomina phaseolina (strain MS6) TaxID=1126212 RepID=K2RF60_MACPH|nr:hypothetical protein MPH_09534 [Macrophomina phaseolina MS6]